MSKYDNTESLLGLAARDQKDLQLDWFNFWNTLHVNALSRDIMDQHMVAHWESLRQSQSKLCFYNSVKTSYGFEEYLDLRRRDRKMVAKMRVSAHDLRIETSRYPSLKLPNHCRSCCDDPEMQLLGTLPFSESIIESEEHAITSCEAYSHLRSSLPASLAQTVKEKDYSSIFSREHSKQLNRFLTNCINLRDNA